MQTGRLLQSCAASLPFPSFLGWPTLAKSLGSFLCFSHWCGKARKSASSPTVFPSTPHPPLSLSLLIQADGNWVQHSQICQIQPHCPCKIAPAESHRTVFRGLRSLCLIYNAWRKALSSDSPWEGEKETEASLCWVYLIMAELCVTFGKQWGTFLGRASQ